MNKEKSFEDKPHEGSSPSSGTKWNKFHEDLNTFLRKKGFKMILIVDTQAPGIAGHPVAIGYILQFLKDEFEK